MKLALGIVLGVVIGFVGGCVVGGAIAEQNQQFSLQVGVTPHGVGVSGRLPSNLTTPYRGQSPQLPWSGTLPPPRVVESAPAPTETWPKLPCGVNAAPCGLADEQGATDGR